MRSIRQALYIFLAISILGCINTSNKEKITGKWESVFKKRIEGIEIPTVGPEEKVVLTFNSDMTLKSEAMMGDEVMETNTGTYDLENGQKYLVVYREGMKDRKNISEIVTLNDKVLTLVDTSGGEDTLFLNRAN